ncbi:hypothetical protein [Priestia aryabhattai]
MNNVIQPILVKEDWEKVFIEMENVKLEGLWKDRDKLNLHYTFCFELTTKRKQKVIAHISISEYKGELQVGFSTRKTTQELHKLASRLVDQLVNKAENINEKFKDLKENGPIRYPDHYISEKLLQERKAENQTIKKADILSKRNKIVSLYEELKMRDLPRFKFPDGDLRTFQVKGRNVKYLNELFEELGIVKEISGPISSYYTIRFKSDDYKIHLYTAMEEWKTFIREEIGFECYVER